MFSKNIMEAFIDNVDVKSQLEQQIQKQETKGSSWRFAKSSSMTIHFYKTTKLKGSNY